MFLQQLEYWSSEGAELWALEEREPVLKATKLGCESNQYCFSSLQVTGGETCSLEKHDPRHTPAIIRFCVHSCITSFVAASRPSLQLGILHMMSARKVEW